MDAAKLLGEKVVDDFYKFARSRRRYPNEKNTRLGSSSSELLKDHFIHFIANFCASNNILSPCIAKFAQERGAIRLIAAWVFGEVSKSFLLKKRMTKVSIRLIAAWVFGGFLNLQRTWCFRFNPLDRGMGLWGMSSILNLRFLSTCFNPLDRGMGLWGWLQRSCVYGGSYGFNPLDRGMGLWG